MAKKPQPGVTSKRKASGCGRGARLIECGWADLLVPEEVAYAIWERDWMRMVQAAFLKHNGAIQGRCEASSLAIASYGAGVYAALT